MIEKLKIEYVEADKIPIDILLEADPDEEKVRGYLDKSYCYLGRIENCVVGAFILMPLNDEKVELMNIAVSPAHQKQGIGRRLLEDVVERSRELGFKWVELGTGSFGYQLTYYQRAGFRVKSVVRDFFIDNYSQPIYEFGIQHKDMLRMEMKL